MDNLELRFFDGSMELCKIYLSAEIIKESENKIKIKPTKKSELIFRVLNGFGVQSGALFQNNRMILAGNLFLVSKEESIYVISNTAIDTSSFYSSNIKLLEFK